MLFAYALSSTILPYPPLNTLTIPHLTLRDSSSMKTFMTPTPNQM